MKDKKGLSLIELLATIVIMGIIALIAVPLIGGLIDRAKTNANLANIESLNEATRLYQLGESIISDDIFLGLDTNSERINTLFSFGYLDRLVQPIAPYPSYEWSIADQIWVLGDTIEIVSPNLSIYVFDDVRLIDMISYGSTISNGSFSDQGDSLQSGGGLMYIPNPNESYTLTLEAKILEPGTYGGFGLLFDTTATDMDSQTDTGFIVQVDRGYASGEIIIRPRLNGKEQNPLYRYGVRFDDEGNFTLNGGTKDNQNPWWTALHELKLVVEIEDATTNQKSISVYIDDVFIFDYVFTSSLFEENALDNLTGFRTWSGVDVAFYALSIE